MVNLYTDLVVLAFSRWLVKEEQKSVLHENEKSASTEKITQVPQGCCNCFQRKWKINIDRTKNCGKYFKEKIGLGGHRYASTEDKADEETQI